MVDWSPGSERAGLSPVVVVQTDAANLNPRYPKTIVLSVSKRGKAVPFHVPIIASERNGLEERSFVKCEQVLTISKERLVRFLGRLEGEYLDLISASLREVLKI